MEPKQFTAKIRISYLVIIIFIESELKSIFKVRTIVFVELYYKIVIISSDLKLKSDFFNVIFIVST